MRVHASSLFDIKIWTTDYTNFTKICIFIDLFIYASTQPPTQKTESFVDNSNLKDLKKGETVADNNKSKNFVAQLIWLPNLTTKIKIMKNGH